MNKKKYAIAAVFFASGFSSLVYQVAWQRILTLYYSVENLSTTLIVSVYMLGLGLGAIAGGRIAEKVENKVRFYFFIELAIGAFGLISIPFLEVLGANTAGAGHAVSFVCMFAFLCLPTMLMGMTLPLLTKIFNDGVNNFLQSLSYLYFINTLGAAAGALTTSYVFISFGGLDISIYIAAGINLLIAASLLAFKRILTTIHTSREQEQPDPSVVPASDEAHGLSRNLIYGIVFVTGFIAIGYEIIWFRMMGTIVKASAYSFSTVLAVYLMGIALGSYLMKRLLAGSNRFRSVNRRNLFFTIQVLIALYVLFSISAYHYLVNHVPAISRYNFSSFNNLLHPTIEPPPNYRPGSLVMWAIHRMDIVLWPTLFILVPTLLMGASFPLITSLAYKNHKEADTVGRIYFYNVLGNVTGGLLTGLLLLGVAGTEYSLLFFSFLGLMFIFFNGKGLYVSGTPAKAVTLVCIIALSIFFFPGRIELYKTIHPKYVENKSDSIWITEGTDAVIGSYKNGDKLVTFINGMAHGGRPNPFFYHEAIQALAYRRDMKRVLVIGFGTGSTFEAILLANPKPKITLAELSETLLDNLRQVDTLNRMLNDPNVNIIYADGRKYLCSTDEKFDAIFMDPLRTTTSFSNNIYSKEFFDLIKSHLADSGIFMTWMDELHVVPKTLCAVFPYINMYSRFAISSNSPLHEDTTYRRELTEKFETGMRSRIFAFSAAETNIRSRVQVLHDNSAYPINRDYRPVCEYFIGYLGDGRGKEVMFYDHPLMRE